MRILYFISVHEHGRGGHLHSLIHISNEIEKDNDIGIISIGSGNNNIVARSNNYLGHIKYNGINIFQVLCRLNHLINEFKPDIFHFFDDDSYNILRIFINSKREKIVLNKCGGPNPIRYPYVKNLILFSDENYDWFENHTKYRRTNITLIPNRVRALIPSNDINVYRNTFIFLRICRIGKTYKKSICDSVNLIKKMHDLGINHAKLLVVGVVEDEEIYAGLVEESQILKESITFITNEKDTAVASKFICMANAVIGTGRGFMEAASVGKPLLAINKDENIPLLIDSNNYNDAFKTNFSERNCFQNYSEKDNLEKITNLILDDSYYSELKQYSLLIFKNDFDIKNASVKYQKAYLSLEYGKRRIFQDFLLILRSNYRYMKGYIKRNKS